MWILQFMTVRFFKKVSNVIVSSFLLHMYYTEPLMEHLVEFVIPQITGYWEDIAYILGYGYADIQRFKEQQFHDAKKCCRELIINWLSTKNGPKTWSMLLTNLRRLDDLTAVAENIEQKLQKPSVVDKYI